MFAITGATGQVGREVVNLLLAQDQRVVAVTRTPSSAALPKGAEIVSPETLTLRGVESILLVPRAIGTNAVSLLTKAASQGVRRVVVISASTVTHPVGYPRFAAHFASVENAARSSGLQWTLLRCADFASNSLGWAAQIRETGKVRGAYSKAATSPIHERDIAEAATVALTDPQHANRAYLLTGPQSLTQPDKAKLIGEAIGKEIPFEEVPPEQVRAAMLAAGLAEEIPDRLLGSLADYVHQAGPTSHDVAHVLGRPAQSFAKWAAEHAAAFRS